jgi:hypothetical protein
MKVAPPEVQAPYGPTLPQLLEPRTRGVPPFLRVAIPALIALIVLAALAYKVLKAPGGTHVVVKGPVTFNFRYVGPLHRYPAQNGDLVHLEARRGPEHLFLYSFTVRPLHLPAYKGQVSAFLPSYATQFERTLAKQFPGFQVVSESRQRVVNEIAYAIFFQARLGQRTLTGRDILLPEPQPGARTGAELLLLSTPAGGAALPASVGQSGPLSTPFHTFRFGTSGP